MAKSKKPTESVDEQLNEKDVVATGGAVQPESPKGEGVDPLTEGVTLYPAEDVKGNAAKAPAVSENNAQALPASDVPNSDTSEQDEVAAGRTE